MTIPDVAIVFAGWAVLLWSPPLRTTRTLMFLGALTIAFVTAGLLGVPGSSIVRIVLTCIYVLAYWRFLSWLAGNRGPHGEMDARMRQAVGNVTRAHRRWVASYARGDMPASRTARTLTTRVCASAVAELDRLQAPTEQWREAVRLLRAYFVALKTAAESEAGEAATSTGTPRDDALIALNEQANRAWQAALIQPDTGNPRKPAPTP